MITKWTVELCVKWLNCLSFWRWLILCLSSTHPFCFNKPKSGVPKSVSILIKANNRFQFRSVKLPITIGQKFKLIFFTDRRLLLIATEKCKQMLDALGVQLSKFTTHAHTTNAHTRTHTNKRTLGLTVELVKQLTTHQVFETKSQMKNTDSEYFVYKNV